MAEKKTKSRNGILLESGTNEIEVMKFRVQGELYGINVVFEIGRASCRERV